MQCLIRLCAQCPYFSPYQKILKTEGRCIVPENTKQKVPKLTFSQFMLLLISPDLDKETKEFIKRNNQEYVKKK